MRLSRWVCAALLALVASPAAALAQDRGTITGQVVEAATQEPIQAAWVTIAGTNLGVLTNAEGRFVIPAVRPGATDVRVTLIGYGSATQPVNVTAGETAVANFELSSSVVLIDGLMVTATGRTERTRAIGNAVGNISVAELDLSAVNSMANLMQSRAPGVTVLPSTGTTGSGSRIRIRGSNSISLSNEPLVIVDGIRVTNSAAGSGAFTISTGGQTPSRLDDLNPEDIESIEVLKGPAAAAMYGTAAANGVIQITTKRGRSGAPRWHAYTEQGLVLERTAYPDNVVSSSGCRVFDVAEGLPPGPGEPGCQEIGELIRFNTLKDPATTPFIDGSRRVFGASVAGGGDATTYYVATQTLREQGVYEPNKLKRVNLRANVTSQIRDDLSLSVHSGLTFSDLGMPQNDNNFSGPILNAMLGHPDTLNASNRGYLIENWDALRQLESTQELRRVNASARLQFQPVDWLSIVANTGADLVSRHDHAFLAPGQILNLGSPEDEGFRRSNRVDDTTLTHTLDATGTFTLRPNLVSNTSIGVQYHGEKYSDSRGFGVGPAPGTKSLGGTSKLFEVSETTIENVTVGGYVQQQLGLSDRLYVTAAVRGDDNSAFGSEFGFAMYPSLSASWVISEEPFFPAVEAITSLRLRSALGRSGLRPSFRDAIAYYNPVSVRLNAEDLPGITLAGTGNPDLKPEVATEVEVGFDLGLFQDRVGLELTYYNKTSDDALIERRIAPSVGATTTRFENIGRMSNRGVEALLNLRVVDAQTLRWNATIAAGTNRNRLVALGEDVEPIIFGLGSMQRHVEGYPAGGYWEEPVTWQDQNGDGLLQLDEVTVGDSAVFLGTPFPKREISLSSSVTLFDRVRVSGLLDHKGGHHIYNFTYGDRCSWEQLCPSTYDMNASLRDQAGFIAWNEYNRNSSLYVEPADFWKLRELAVSIDVPSQWISGYGLGRASLTLAGRNLATWTDFRGLDPEVNTNGQANFSTAAYYTQPPVRYYTARFDISF